VRGKKAQAMARLCYVDDSRTAAYVVRRQLEPLGYLVDHFCAAEPAFVALIQGDYDLLLTDLKVSSTGMDGDDLIRTLRQSGHPKISTLPIIVITGSTDAKVLVGVYDVGANQVMNKPVDAGELDGHIRRLLFDGHRAAQEAASPVPEASKPAAVAPLLSSNASPPAESAVPVLDVVDASSGQEPESPTKRIPTPERIGAFFHSQQPEPPLVEIEIPDVVPEPEEPVPEQVVSPEPDVLHWEDTVEDIIIEPDSSAQRSAWHSQGADDAAPHRHRFPPRAERDGGEGDILSDHDYALVSTQRRRLLRGWGPRAWLSRVVLPSLVVVIGLVVWEQFTDWGQSVDTALVTRGEIYQSIRAPARIVSQQTVIASPASSGRLVDVAVNEGDIVSAGQVLARLDNREQLRRLSRAEADLISARKEITRAKRTLDRLRKAHRKGAVTQRFVGDAEVNLRTARNNVGIAVENVHKATQELEKQTITAAISGVVAARNAEVDQWVGPTDGLFSLADSTRLAIEARINAAASSGITAGQIVSVSGGVDSGQQWQEAVTGLGAGAPQTPGVVNVRISLGPNAPVLRIGQPVNVEIRTAWNPDALNIPFDALISRDGQTLVAVLEEGRVRLRVVETGIEDLTMAEIKQGLASGDRVILANGRQLMDGDKVYAEQVPD